MIQQKHKKTGYGRGRTFLEKLEEGDWNSKATAIIRYSEDVDWGDLPDEIVERFSRLSQREMVKLASKPSEYGCGTFERAATYRIRQALRIKFDKQGGFSFFHPEDKNDSPLGTPMGRSREPGIEALFQKEDE